MRTMRRLIYGEIVRAVGFVLLAFMALFSFFDLVDELSSLGRVSPFNPELVYGLQHALWYVALLMPNRIYELLPISILIGTVFVLARLAESSEYTILRTSGLGPWRALRLLLGLGAMFVVLTFAMGDYIAPWADRQAQLLKAQFRGGISVGRTGAWLKERNNERQYSVNVGAMQPDGALERIRLFEFDLDGRLLATTQAERGHIVAHGQDMHWALEQVQQRVFDTRSTTAHIATHTLPRYVWPTHVSAEMVSVALLQPDRMRTLDLFTYIQHLQTNNQTAQRYEIEFWRKVFYPLSCLVMVVLALPFAYLHFRSGGVAGYVFAGVMIGISFFLLNNVFGYIGNLRLWQPWLAAAAPSLLYSLASLGAFGWLVLKR